MIKDIYYSLELSASDHLQCTAVVGFYQVWCWQVPFAMFFNCLERSAWKVAWRSWLQEPVWQRSSRHSRTVFRLAIGLSGTTFTWPTNGHNHSLTSSRLPISFFFIMGQLTPNFNLNYKINNDTAKFQCCRGPKTYALASRSSSGPLVHWYFPSSSIIYSSFYQMKWQSVKLKFGFSCPLRPWWWLIAIVIREGEESGWSTS